VALRHVRMSERMRFLYLHMIVSEKAYNRYKKDRSINTDLVIP